MRKSSTRSAQKDNVGTLRGEAGRRSSTRAERAACAYSSMLFTISPMATSPPYTVISYVISVLNT